MSRWLYDELGGFDAEMWEWGIEDVDLGLRAWLMGYSVLHDPDSVIGHRFSGRFDNFTVAQANVLANKMRMARKSFADPTWREWIRKSRSRRSKKTWNVAWKVFQKYRISVERERERLLSRRVHDEFWFARRFGLKWPRRPGQAALASRKRSAPAHEPRS